MNADPHPVVRITRHLKVSPKRIYDAWLDRGMIGRWIFGPAVKDEEVLRVAVDPRVGRLLFFPRAPSRPGNQPRREVFPSPPSVYLANGTGGEGRESGDYRHRSPGEWLEAYFDPRNATEAGGDARIASEAGETSH